jgi:three-Cys-motif partner protein
MSNKINTEKEKEDFFDRKKPWSKIKDNILTKYLEPYINKIKELKRPIVIVDGFAGPGKFSDGFEGSPLIICKRIDEERSKLNIPIFGIFIDKKKRHYTALKNNLQNYIDGKIVFVFREDFGNLIEEIIELVKDSSVLFYLDPFGIRGIEFDKLQKIFERVNIASTEVLINFNYSSFVRQAGNWNVYDSSEEIKKKVKMAKLDNAKKVMGGDYWLDIVENSQLSSTERELAVVEAYKEKYKIYFKYVCSCPVKEKDANVAKYHLIFASRHFDALDLMNDIMHGEYEKFLIHEYKEGFLFDTRPENKKKDLNKLENMIYELVKKEKPISRFEIRKTLIPYNFMKYAIKDYRACIENLLKNNKIYSSTGKTRINDKVLLSTEVFE